MQSGDVASVTKNNEATLYYENGEEALLTAFCQNGAGNTYNVQLLQDIELSPNKLWMGQDSTSNETPDIINLDLNGHSLDLKGTSTSHLGIRLYKGTLNITGSEGSYIKAANGDLIRVFGAWDDDVANWSTLTIAENVIVENSGYNAITIDCHDRITSLNNINSIGIKGTKFKNHPDYTTTWTGDYGHAYGVNVTINGTVYGKKYGIKVNGLAVGEGDNAPKVTISSTAHVSCYGSNTGDTDLGAEAVAVYSSGIGNFVIEGEVAGNNAVVLKGGSVTVQGDAKIVATGQWNPVTKDSNSGVGASGSAITLITQSGYAGNAQLTVTDNATVSSEYGYAVYEGNKTQGENNSTVSGIHIESGTFSAGTGENQGVISGSQALLNNDKVTVDGGNFTDATILDYVNTNSVIVAEDSEGEVKYTLTPKPEGATEPVVTPGEDPVLNDVSSTDIVKLQYGTTGQTLTTDVECAYLSISNAQTVTIPVGKTLTAGTVVLGEDAQIVVEAGGKLVVTGTTGIVAFNSNNLVLETSDDAPAQLLLAPEATANTRPAATVILKSKSWRIDADHKVYQFFGTPVTDVTAFTMNGTSDRMAYVYQLGSTATIGSLTVASPFANPALFQEGVIYYLLSNNDAENLLDYSFKGNLLGNNNIVANVETNWSPFANSYTGNISVNELLSALSTEYGTDNSTVETNVYTYSYIGANKLSWNVNNLLDGISNVAPMQPIMLKNHGTATNFTVDYEDLVWNARNSAPARKALPEMDKVKVHVTAADGSSDYVVLAQADQFSAEYENGYDAEKYMNDFMNLYVNDERKQQTFATNNINNTLIGFDVVEAGLYTLSFSDVMGNDLVLVDLANGAQVNIEEGATYTFAASANETNDARFQIVEARKMPTDVETIEAAKAQKGIYSLVGAYLGEDFDVLPAGIYVVNGVKVVK